MPQFYSIRNWNDRGKVAITPKSFWRRVPILKQALPYFVGDIVQFTINIDKSLDEINGYIGNPHVVWERFEGDWKQLCYINNKKTEVTGNRISSEGNIEYSIGENAPYYRKEPILTAKVLNWDSILAQWVWLIVGALISLIIGVCLWALGFIKIIPFWKIWIS